METQPDNPLRPERNIRFPEDASTCWMFRLPNPVSTNELWEPKIRQTKTGRVYPTMVLSAKYKSWIEEAERMMLAQPRPKEPLTGAITVYIRVPVARRDLDNMLKGPLDILQSSGVIRDDVQVDNLTVSRKRKHDPDTISVDIYVADILR